MRYNPSSDTANFFKKRSANELKALQEYYYLTEYFLCNGLNSRNKYGTSEVVHKKEGAYPFIPTSVGTFCALLMIISEMKRDDVLCNCTPIGLLLHGVTHSTGYLVETLINKKL